MISIKEHMPKSAKVLPCWVFINGKYDLAYLTEDEKKFCINRSQKSISIRNSRWMEYT